MKHEAGDVAFILRQWASVPGMQIVLVREILDDALLVLKKAPDPHGDIARFIARVHEEGFIESATNYDYLSCTQGNAEQVAAGNVAVWCCQVIRNGRLDELDYSRIPLFAQKMLGSFRGHQATNAKRLRPKAEPKHNALLLELARSIRANPLSCWKVHAKWLKDDEVIADFDDESIIYFDSLENKQSISRDTFSRLLKLAKEPFDE